MAKRGPLFTKYQKYFYHPFQGMLAHSVFFLMGLLPFATASALGGAIGRALGPRLGVTKLSRENLAACFPEKTEAEREKIMSDMWESIGRNVFEYPHIGKVDVYRDKDHFEVIGEEYIHLLRDDEQPGIYFSGHLANWEFASLSIAQHEQFIPLHLIFRAPDNPWVAKLFDERRPPHSELIPKGSKGARQALNVLKNGGHLAMLVDQKMNDGMAVPFFGYDAWTAPAIAQFALKYDCPVVPVRVERIKGTRFRITLHPPITIEKTGNRHDDMLACMVQINQILEGWIRERPEQWLWVHRRWPRGAFEATN